MGFVFVITAIIETEPLVQLVIHCVQAAMGLYPVIVYHTQTTQTPALMGTTPILLLVQGSLIRIALLVTLHVLTVQGLNRMNALLVIQMQHFCRIKPVFVILGIQAALTVKETILQQV